MNDKDFEEALRQLDKEFPGTQTVIENEEGNNILESQYYVNNINKKG